MGHWKHGYYYSRGQYVPMGTATRIAIEADDLRRQAAEREREQRLADALAFQAARGEAAAVDKAASTALSLVGLRRHARGVLRRARNPTVSDDLAKRTVQAAALDLAAVVETATLKNALPGNQRLQAKAAAKLAELRAELLDGSTDAALRLAVEVAAHAWFTHWHAESLASSGKTVSPELERRRSFAAKRFGRALADVARIKRLLEPRPSKTMQVYIDKRNQTTLSNKAVNT